MAWIESHQALLTHRKTGRLSRALGVSRVTAIGHLHVFWWWCLDNAPEGDLTGVDTEDITDGAAWEGDPEKFIDAMVYAGFLDRDPSAGTLCVHDWMEFAGKLIQRRKTDAARKRDSRHSQDIPQMSEGCPPDVGTTARVPNQPNQPNPTNPTAPTNPTPSGGPGADAPAARGASVPGADDFTPSISEQVRSDRLSDATGKRRPTRAEKDRAYIEETLAAHPDWREPLADQIDRIQPGNADAYAVPILRGWEQKGGPPGRVTVPPLLSANPANAGRNGGGPYPPRKETPQEMNARLIGQLADAGILERGR